MEFAIVKFLGDEDGARDVVPLKWIDQSKDMCHYPNTKIPYEKKISLVKKNASPDTNWPLWKIQIMRKYGDSHS